MFSKTQGVLLFAAVVVGAGFWYQGKKQNERIRQLAVTEARLQGITREMAIHQRLLDDLNYKIQPLWEQRKEMREADSEITALAAEVKRLTEIPSEDSSIKWSFGATVELEEYILPPNDAGELLDKFAAETEDDPLRQALRNRKNAVFYSRKFETVVLPEPRRVDPQAPPEFTTSIYSGHPVNVRGAGYALNKEASYASELERLFVHSEIRSNFLANEVQVSIHEAAGLMLGTWVINRSAAIPGSDGHYFDIHFQTRTPVTGKGYHFVGTTNFRLMNPEADGYRAKRGTLFVFAKVTIHRDREEVAP